MNKRTIRKLFHDANNNTHLADDLHKMNNIMSNSAISERLFSLH